MITNQPPAILCNRSDDSTRGSGSKPFRKARPSRPKPTAHALRFSPTAWAKLLFLRDLGDTEIGGFGITAADDLLYVDDLQLVRQVCTAVSVAFDDNAVADFFDRQVDAGRRPECCGRIWLHTHPGSSAEPSMIDEDTFARVFGGPNWALMFILARGGQRYARLRFNVGPGGQMEIPATVDYGRPFPASNQEAWQAEYLANVQPEPLLLGDPVEMPRAGRPEFFDPLGTDADWLDGWPNLFDERVAQEDQLGLR